MAEAEKEGKEKKERGKESREKSEEEIALDFGKVKHFFSGLFKGEKGEERKQEKEAKVEALPKEERGKEKGEEIALDFSKIKDFFIKYKIVLLLLIPIFLSTFFRVYPAYLPVTDDWARNAVYNSIRTNIAQQIDKQYPNLLETNREILIEKEFQKVLEEQKTQIEQQIKGTSDYFKSQMKDDKGNTYLIGIDSYFWLGEAGNYVENGYFGTEIVNGTPMNLLRNGRRGLDVPTEKALPYSEAQLYKILRIFDPDISLMYVCFLIPIIYMALSIIPAFFIGRKIAGDIGGFFAATFLAVQPFLVGRLLEPDTDIFQIFFPLMILWLFVEAVEAKKIQKKAIFASLSGLFIGLYSVAWKGWWYIFDFALATLGLYFIYCLLVHRKELKKGFLSYIKYPALKEILIIAGVFLLSSAIFVSLFGQSKFMSAFEGPFGFMRIKEVAVTTLWPNVFTTVAEFNPISVKGVVSTMGGNFLFLIALAGIALTMLKKDNYGKMDIKYAVLLAIWFPATIYSATKGSRFILLLVPAFAVAFGIAMGTTYKYASVWITKGLGIDKKIAKISLVVLLCLLLISPVKAAHNTAKGYIPNFNDAWYGALTEIKNESSDAIITSWWDFGHWFVTIGERRVTFDGADQGMRIHWVGKTLLTDSEEEAVAILRMLNCDQDYAYRKLYNYTNDVIKSVNIVYDIIMKDKEEARNVLRENNLSEEQINDVLLSTHCDNLIDQYFIASEDMIGKTGVWSHFGSWDFNRAKMYQTVKGKLQEEGIAILKDKFGLSQNEAFTIYYEIQNNEADHWVSSWPNYAGGLASCSEAEDIIKCGNGLQFNTTTRDAFILTQQGMLYPKSIVYPIKNEAGEDDLFEKVYLTDTAPVSAALIPTEEGFKSIYMDPKLAYSIFTRLFFYEGRGLKHFKLFSSKQSFTGENIYVYKVDF